MSGPSMFQSKRTWDRLTKLAGRTGTGVEYCRGLELHTRSTVPPPDWHHIVNDFVEHKGCSAVGVALGPTVPSEVIQDYQTAHEFTSVMMNPPVYLGFLLHWAKSLGVRLRCARFETMESCEKDYPGTTMLINCTGGAANRLCEDPKLFKSKGQTVKVFAPVSCRNCLGLRKPISRPCAGCRAFRGRLRRAIVSCLCSAAW